MSPRGRRWWSLRGGAALAPAGHQRVSVNQLPCAVGLLVNTLFVLLTPVLLSHMLLAPTLFVLLQGAVVRGAVVLLVPGLLVIPAWRLCASVTPNAETTGA